MSFIFEYLKHPRRIGAIAPSGKCLSRKMMQPIDFTSAEVIVEYGPGTGSFTNHLVAEKNPDTSLILIEQNEHFCRQLNNKYGDMENVHIIHGYAEDVETYLDEYGFEHADYIISGLPFTSLPEEVSDRILTATISAMGDAGRFITFQYSLVKRHFFEQYFNITNYLREFRNLPPAYVLVMKNRSE